MTIPVYTDSEAYYEHLRQFRDEALVSSNWYGRRKNLGGFVFGTVTAGWQAECGGIADLRHTGIRFKNSNITRIMPTTLRIIQKHDRGGNNITTFSMDLDDIGSIDVHRTLLKSGSYGEIALSNMSRLIDKNNRLQYPTESEKELIYTELQRGVSGKYSLDIN